MDNKISYNQEVTNLIMFTILQRISELDYADLTDVTTTANTPIVIGEEAIITEWRKEANGILLWVTNLWVERNKHIDSLEFPNNLQPLQFVNNLPIFGA